jgi:surface antigen
MNPAILLSLMNSSMKKQIAFVVMVLVIILSLPMVAVFALGTSTLAFLSGGFSSSVDTNFVSTQSVGVYQGPLITGDNYAWGNCTYWVFALRLQAGDPIPNSWGNASTWAYYAAKDGYTVDHTPAVGSIMQISDVDKGLGHVAYVTAVDPTSGAWTISEMNVEGLDIVDLKTYPASAAAGFNFIHDKEALIHL